MAAPAATLELLLEEVRSLRREVADLRRGSGRLLSFREVARRLKIDRKALPEMAADGTIKVVPFRDGQRVPASEVERIEREGLRPATVARRRIRPAAVAAGDIRKIPLD